MKIAIDADDVLLELMRDLIAFYNRSNGTSFKYENHKHYGLYETWNCTPEEAVENVHNFYASQEFLHDLKPVPGAVEANNYLSEKHQLYVVTSRPKLIETATEYQINKYLNTNIFITTNI